MHQGLAHTFSRQSRRAAARKAAPLLACARVSVRPCIRAITIGNALGNSIVDAAAQGANGSTWNAEKQAALDNALRSPGGLMADDAAPMTQAQRYANAYGGSAVNVADFSARGSGLFDASGNEISVSEYSAFRGKMFDSAGKLVVDPETETGLSIEIAGVGSQAPAELNPSPALGLRDSLVEDLRGSALGRSNAGQVFIGGINAWLQLPESLINTARAVAALPSATAQSISQRGVGGAALYGWGNLVEGARSSFFGVAYGRNGEARGAALFAAATSVAGSGVVQRLKGPGTNALLASKLSFDQSLNVVDRTFSIKAGEVLAENPVGVAAYSRLLRQGTEIKFVNDPVMPDMGQFDAFKNTVTVNMLRHSSAMEAASTVVHEALHQNRFFKGAQLATQYEEYLAFRSESLFSNGTRPSLGERQRIWRDVQELYPHLPQGRSPFGGQR